VNTTKILVNCTNDNCSDHGLFLGTPLMYAATFGRVDVVQVLLEGGANVEKTDANLWTALHSAALNGHLDVCRLLLDWGARVDSLNERNGTPLHWAVSGGHLSVVKLLVERGADVGLKDALGETASGIARRWGRRAVAEWLDSVSSG